LILPARRFPPPCTVEEQEACFVVGDHDGQALAYVYVEEESGPRLVDKVLNKNEKQQTQCLR
jgi:hypothetical protein